MKLIAFVFVSVAGFAVAQTPPPVPAPTLSTSDRVAISTFEKAKQDASKQFTEAQQEELTILREWGVAHPGWHVNQNFSHHYEEYGEDQQLSGKADVLLPRWARIRVNHIYGCFRCRFQNRLSQRFVTSQ